MNSEPYLSKNVINQLFHILLTNPEKRALVLDLLVREGLMSKKSVMKNFKQFQNNDLKGSSTASIQGAESSTNQPKIEYPSTLLRRRALQQLENASSDISNQDNTPPILEDSSKPLNEVLSGTRVFCEVKSSAGDRSGAIKDILRSLGATVRETFTKDVSHVVFKDGSFATYQRARKLRVYFVSVLWVKAVQSHKRRVPESLFPVIGAGVRNVDLTHICQHMEKEYENEMHHESNQNKLHPNTRNSTKWSDSSLSITCASSNYTSDSEPDLISNLTDDNKSSSSQPSSHSKNIRRSDSTKGSDLYMGDTDARKLKDSWELEKSLKVRSPPSAKNNSISKTPAIVLNEEETQMCLRISTDDSQSKSNFFADKLSDSVKSNDLLHAFEKSVNVSGDCQGTINGNGSGSDKRCRRTLFTRGKKRSFDEIESPVLPLPIRLCEDNVTFRRSRPMSITCIQRSDAELTGNSSEDMVLHLTESIEISNANDSINGTGKSEDLEQIVNQEIASKNQNDKETNINQENLNFEITSENPSDRNDREPNVHQENEVNNLNNEIASKNECEKNDDRDQNLNQETANKNDLVIEECNVGNITSDKAIQVDLISETRDNVDITKSNTGTDNTRTRRFRKLFRPSQMLNDSYWKNINETDTNNTLQTTKPINTTHVRYKVQPIVLTKRRTKSLVRRNTGTLRNVLNGTKNKPTVSTNESSASVVRKSPRLLPNNNATNVDKSTDDKSIPKKRIKCIPKDLKQITKPNRKALKVDISTKNTKKNTVKSKKIPVTQNIVKNTQPDNFILTINPSSRRSTLDFQQRPPRKTLAAQKLTQQQKAKPKATGIVFTLFPKNDVKHFKDIVKKLGKFFVEDKVSHRTTHVVTAKSARSINMLRALARGCWIVKREWLTNSLEAGKWLLEEYYEMTEFSKSVQRNRLDRKAFGEFFSVYLFNDCGQIYVSKSSSPPCAELQELLCLCGGTLVKSIFQAKIVVGEKVTNDKIICVNEQWVLDSITDNKRKSMRHYILK